MKVKELKRTVNVSWSPASHHPVMLATGTAAQQVDSSFSSSAFLEVYSLNLNDPGYDLECIVSVPSQNKFQKLCWSSAGVLVGGCDAGLLNFYNVDRLLKGDTNCLMASNTKHNGHVSSLDINPFQKNLLASGASDSEIYIWDLNNTNTPMSPGNKSQPYDHVQGVAWNQQVQHILASTFATRCVVWDLRKNEPIMKLSDAQSRTRWRSAAWHPSVATQICIASEDDQVPVIQLWDLRLAASPLATLERHTKGVMAVSWNAKDPDLLLSASKDGTVLCWNPNISTPGGEMLCEVSSEGQWVFDVSWCPRSPSLLVSSSFDGHVNIHSVNGGTKPNVWNKNSNIMESFPGMESISNDYTNHPEPVTGKQLLPRPPLWDKRPVGAKFAFGGKLVTFDKQVEPGTPKTVFISQIIGDSEVGKRAAELNSILKSHDLAPHLAQYCRQRGDQQGDQNERYTWFFLKANFEPEFRTEALNLLGFKQDEIESKLRAPGHQFGDGLHSSFENNVDSITSGIAGLSRGASLETETELSTDTSTDLSDANALIDRKLNQTDFSNTAKNVFIPTGDDVQGMICRSLISGKLEEAVELCLEAKRTTDALIIASLGSEDLARRVQEYYLWTRSDDPVCIISRTLLFSQWDKWLTDTNRKNWRETLATLVAHCDPQSFPIYCEQLGEKLLSEKEDAELLNAATLCYLCSASVDALVDLWQRKYGVDEHADFDALSQLVELALLAKKAAVLRGRPVQSGGRLEKLLREYAMRLCEEGELEAALNALEEAGEEELTHRLKCALNIAQPYHYAKSGNVYTNQNQTNTRARTTSGHQHNPAPRFSNSGLPQSNEAPVASGVPSRSKYVLDPSVRPNQPSYQNNYNYVQPPQPQNVQSNPYNPPGSFPAAVPAHTTSHNLNQSIMNPSNNMNPAQNIINSAQNITNPAQNVMNPVMNQPQGQSASLMNPMQGFSNTNGEGVSQKQFAPIAPAPPGWNDPPPVSAAPKKVQQQQDSQAPAPITHPLFGVEPAPQHIPLHGSQYSQDPYASQQNQFSNRLPPPPSQFGAQQNQFGVQPQPNQFGAPPSQFGTLPQQNQFGALPQQNQFGAAQQQNQFGAAPQQNQFGPPPQQNQFAPPPPSNIAPNQFASPPTAFSPPPTQFAPRPMSQNSNHFSAPPQGGFVPPQDSFVPPQSQMVGGQMNYQQQQYPAKIESPAPPSAAAPVAVPEAKAPIPEQHIHMQTVLDTLRTQCLRIASNPQMKRKLDDVQRRLENLYDMLRANRLSENALEVLHESINNVQQRNYDAALNTLTVLATGPDFSTVASFLPGVKVLIQLAMQNGVYVN